MFDHNIENNLNTDLKNKSLEILNNMNNDPLSNAEREKIRLKLEESGYEIIEDTSVSENGVESISLKVGEREVEDK